MSYEKQTKSFSFNAVLVRSPLKYLNDTIEAERYFEGVVVSVMYFERFTIDILKVYFKSKGIPLKPMKIEKLRLSTVLKMLEGFGKLSHQTHSLMGEVIKERNAIVHELRDPDTIDEEKAKKTIAKAIRCLRDLGAS